MRIASRFGFSLVIGTACVVGAGGATAQTYPSNPVRFIVANAPGSGLDNVARIVAPGMSAVLGQPIVVENRPGANSAIGSEYVAKRVPADGYAVLATLGTDLALLPLVTKDLRFDPLNDLPPVIGLVEARFVLLSSSTLPWKTFQEMVNYAKANPGKLNYGSVAASSQLPVAAIIQPLGLNIVHIPYSGAGLYFQALSSGDVQLGIMAEGSALNMGEKFRVIAVSGQQPSAMLPGVPTFTELGYPQLRSNNFTLHVPAGTPQAVIGKLYAAGMQTLQQPEVRARFAKLQFTILGETPEAVAKRLEDVSRFFADVARKAGIKP